MSQLYGGPDAVLPCLLSPEFLALWYLIPCALSSFHSETLGKSFWGMFSAVSLVLRVYQAL